MDLAAEPLSGAGQSTAADDLPISNLDEWSDPEADMSPEEERREIQRSRTALYYEVSRRVAALGSPEYRAPEKASLIPTELYEKAEKSNDQLTEEDRALLLSRGDVVGKALASPGSLTEAERYQVLQWSTPGELHAAIREATDGTLSTPEELYDRVFKGSGVVQVGAPEKILAASKFRVDVESLRSFNRITRARAPGNGHARSLLYERAGKDVAFFDELPNPCRRCATPQSPSQDSAVNPCPSHHPHPPQWVSSRPFLDRLPTAADRVEEERPPLGHMLALLMKMMQMRNTAPPKQSRDSRDEIGNALWPLSYPAHLAEPRRLFFHSKLKAEFPGKMFDDVEPDVMQRWQALGEAERASYAAEAEDLRGKAWDQIEAVDTRLGRGESAADLQRAKLPGMDGFVEKQLRELEAKARRGNPAHFPPRPKRSRSGRGADGLPSWPSHVNKGRFRPLGLFLGAQEAQYPGQELREVWGVTPGAFMAEVQRRYDAPSDEDRAGYEARSERLRQETWDEWEEYQRRTDAGEVLPFPRRQNP